MIIKVRMFITVVIIIRFYEPIPQDGISPPFKVRPYTHFSTIFPAEKYVRYYDPKSSEFELLTLIEMAGLYLTKKNIPHVFINTCNKYYKTRDIVNTLIFPGNHEDSEDFGS